MSGTKIVVLSLLAAIWGAMAAVAGTLDDAPFQVILPGDGWKLDDSTAQEMEKNVSIVASVTGTNTQSKSVVIKTDMRDVRKPSFDEFSAGIRDQLANPVIKKLSEEDISFLGFKAKRFTFEVTGASYNESIVFVAGTIGWTIMNTGPLDKKLEIKKLTAFYQQKEK